MLKQLLGGISLLGGILMLVYFPFYTGKYQPEAMSKAGIAIGIILIALGIWMLKS